MKIRDLPGVSLAIAVSISLTYQGTPPPQAKATKSRVVVIPYSAEDFRYKIGDHGHLEGFEQPSFDDFMFKWGPAPFGRGPGGPACGLDTTVRTKWPLNTDLIVRKPFYLPMRATDLRVSVAIDNHVQVFINGHDISGGLRWHSGCPKRGDFVFQAPDNILKVGQNWIAVRARDVGVDCYLDLEVTAEFEWI